MLRTSDALLGPLANTNLRPSGRRFARSESYTSQITESRAD